MKLNASLVLRFIGHFMFSLLLLVLLGCVGILLVTELFWPREGNQQDLAVLVGLLSIIILFVAVYGWYVGRPLLYIIGWISRLAGGNYSDPDNHRKLYSKSDKLKRPYRLFKELIDQLHSLSDALERSKQESMRVDKLQKEWIAGISHDLKTPLTYIKGYSSMLLSDQYNWNAEEQTKFLAEIQQKADHMQDLIGDLNLSFRLEGQQQLPIQLEKHDLVEFTRRIVVDVANDPRAADCYLIFETDEPHIAASLDAKLLRRALHNLLLNAVLHNPAGTRIQMRIIRHPHPQIVIADNGDGMDEQTVEMMFNKYYRGTPTDVLSEGTGLGMAIAKQLVLAHGGHIHVASRLHEGTTITVTLPLQS